MPKTRIAESRDVKAAAILEVAERRLREGGYPALSVAAIARELGLAQNTLYWYFPSKDDLFVATLGRMLEQIHGRKPSRKAGKIEQILWFTDQFEELSGLRAAMNERARSSTVVAEFVQELDALLSRMLAGALSDEVPAEDLPLAVEAFRATVEGTFVKGLDQRERRRVLSYALRGLIGERGRSRGAGARQRLG
jgi:AcrR family transcriptional regulator